VDRVTPASRSESPPLVLWAIAALCLSPFVAAAIVFSYGSPKHAASALDVLMTWSAGGVSFLAGVRWGLETREPNPRWQRQGFSALASLAAWVILLARGHAPDTWILGGFIVAFLIQWLFDHQTPDTPSRYPILSTAVTTVACVSLALALEKALHA
jgi:hypothetical protein